MARISLDVHLDRFPEINLRRFMARTIGRAARDVAALYRRNIRAELDARTVKRTGTLRRSVKVRSRRIAGGRVFRPDFPATAYNTPPTRGRRGASKSGQYAFVVNHRTHFISVAAHRTERDPELRRILVKHARFILAETLAGR